MQVKIFSFGNRLNGLQKVGLLKQFVTSKIVK